MPSIADRLKELREDNDLKLYEIAEKLKVNKNTYAHWETLQNDIPIEKLNDLANYYHTTLDYVTGLTRTHKKVANNKKINMSIFRERIKKLRLENNYNQEYIASQLGLSQKTYSNIETGRYTPRTFKIYLLAKIYHVSLDYLLDRK